MCLAVPMKVDQVEGSRGRVSAPGVRLEVGLDLVEGVRPGDYVIVHAGYAISVLSPEEAAETLEILGGIAEEAG